MCMKLYRCISFMGTVMSWSDVVVIVVAASKTVLVVVVFGSSCMRYAALKY